METGGKCGKIYARAIEKWQKYWKSKVVDFLFSFVKIYERAKLINYEESGVDIFIVQWKLFTFWIQGESTLSWCT
jgi:hypothetical protein